MDTPLQTHGGADAHGAVRWDFSTNVNAVGPCPGVLAALHSVDMARYPDPVHHALREQLAQWHGVQPWRVLLAASGSEFIQRMTAVGQRLAPGAVAVPAQAYGDYARAAEACGRPVVAERAAGVAAYATDATTPITLRWCCEPSSPFGMDAAPPIGSPTEARVATVLDAVYAPLRLHGQPLWSQTACDTAFVLHSPNKALGLTGVRGAYAIAPRDTRWRPWAQALNAALPSWPLGAHGVALLQGWASDTTQAWLQQTHTTLRLWKAQQVAALTARGAEVAASVTSFFCMRLALDATPLRQHGVMLRDATSFGLPGWWRLSVQPPAAQQALWAALDAPR